LIAVFIILGAISPSAAKAAASDISVNMVPANPAPGDNVSITLSSYLYDLNTVSISWSVNGKNSSSGVGDKSFSVTAPAAGAVTTVTAVVATSDGNFTETATIRPAMMVLLWQADDSFVPPFYEGKAMPTPESEVKVIALPQIKTGAGNVDPSTMLYTWQKDYDNQADASGYGKNSFIYNSDYLDSLNNISVTAATLDQKYSADANVNIATYQPEIDFYKNDTNMGTLWENALADGHKIAGSEVIEADPYFISPKDIRIPFLTWNWTINGNPVNTPSFTPNLMPVQTQTGVSGTSAISLTINNTNEIFETASKSINVNF
jgi:hypothetical protein